MPGTLSADVDSRLSRLPFRAPRLTAVGLLAGVLAAGCGTGAATTSRQPPKATGAVPAASANNGQTPAQRRMEAVVRAWSARLNAGDNAGIARLFALPAILIQGGYEYRLTTRRQLALWHSSLPCSGAIVSIAYRGRFATAVFRLGNRGKTSCDAPGTLAAARFEFAGGKIVSWAQVAVPATSRSGPVA